MSISLFSGARKHCHFSALKFRFVFVIAFAFWFLTERKIYALKFTRNKRQSIFEASRLRHTHMHTEAPERSTKKEKSFFCSHGTYLPLLRCILLWNLIASHRIIILKRKKAVFVDTLYWMILEYIGDSRLCAKHTNALRIMKA